MFLFWTVRAVWQEALRDWASDPDSAYVAITPDDAELEKIFEELAKNIIKPGATDIVITEKVNSCFKITSVSLPDKGTATLINDTTLVWKIDKLGVKSSEGAALEFTVKHTGSCSGIVEVNDAITYTDKEGNMVNFPSPEIKVDCDINVIPPCCVKNVPITVTGCADTVEFDAGDLNIESTGHILHLDVKLKDVCPNKRVALAVILTELDDKDAEHDRGFKTLTIPAHNRPNCSDVTVRCIRFVLPDDLTGAECPVSRCGTSRKFKTKLIAHYIDNGFECCH